MTSPAGARPSDRRVRWMHFVLTSTPSNLARPCGGLLNGCVGSSPSPHPIVAVGSAALTVQSRDGGTGAAARPSHVHVLICCATDLNASNTRNAVSAVRRAGQSLPSNNLHGLLPSLLRQGRTTGVSCDVIIRPLLLLRGLPR